MFESLYDRNFLSGDENRGENAIEKCLEMP
jgi:hypothetical protein